MFNFGDDKVVIRNNGKYITWQDLKKIICPIITALKSDRRTKFVITCDSNFEFVINFLAGIFSEKELYFLSDSTKINHFGDEYIKNVESKPCEVFELKVPDFNEVIINFYTSGSTGVPKCVRKSLENMYLETVVMDGLHPVEKDLPFVSTVKMSHMFGFVYAFLYPFLYGHVVDTDIIKFPEQIRKEKHVFVSSPSFLDMMAKYDDNPNPPEMIYAAGDKMPERIFEYFSKTSKIFDSYGSTETGTIGYRTSFDEGFLTIFGDVELISDNNKGTIIKSPYFPENELILNDNIELSGKKFKILGRNDRILKIQEKRISAEEIETHLRKEEFVEDAYCFKIGEKAGAAIVLTSEGKEKLLKNGSVEMIKDLKSHLKQFCEIIPQRWRFLPEIPKTSAGKIDKAKILKIYNLNLSYPLIFDKKITNGTAEITLAFLRNSNFFNGHFPDVPILPGVVQLLYAHKLAEDVFGIELSQNKIKKIKFSRVIKPDKKVILKLKNNELSIDFTFTDNEKPFSSGTFIK